VDRFGQTAAQVDAILLYGKDNPIDGAVLDVLIRKAIEIRKDLGVTVPVPVDSESVVEALMRSLFFRNDRNPAQLELPGMKTTPFERIEDVHARWYSSANREREKRTRFAQRAIRREKVAAELEAVDEVLGDPETTKIFVHMACQRLGIHLEETRSGWKLDPDAIQQGVLRDHIGLTSPVMMSFTSPSPERAEYIGRHHPITVAFAEHILATALTNSDKTALIAARSGVYRTEATTWQTTLLLLRIRHLLRETRSARDIMAEECIVVGYRGRGEQIDWLGDSEAKELIDSVVPRQQVSHIETSQRLEKEIAAIGQSLQRDLSRIAERRAKELLDAHRRVRKAAQMGSVYVKPVTPVDVLGLYILLPIPKVG